MGNHIKIILCIIPLLLISGCTVPGTEIEIPFLPNIFGPKVVSYENDILVIKDMEALPNEVAPGQQAKIVVYVENVGSEPMPLDDVGGDIEIELYDYCPGLFELNGPAAYKITSQEKILPGETKMFSWFLRAKEDVKLRTTCPPDGVKVRVKYPYKTTSLTTISFIDYTEMQRRIEEGKFQTKESYIVLGEGPVKPYVTVEDRQPIPVGGGESGSQSETTVLGFQLKNRGSGFVTDSKVPVEKITIRSSNPDIGGPLFDCIRNKVREFRFIHKETSKLLCGDIQIPSKDEIEFTEHVEVSVEYEYEFRKSVVLGVRPKI